MRYITGDPRSQIQLFNCLDDLIPKDDPIRLLDIFIDRIVRENPKVYVRERQSAAGRPPYSPATMLKLYIYGYQEGVSSSRKLERAALENVRFWWLLNKLAPDFKTIADFRKDNAAGIAFCMKALGAYLLDSGLIKGKTVSIDGSKFRANASKSVSLDRLAIREKKVARALEEYLALLDRQDDLENTDDDAAAGSQPEGGQSDDPLPTQELKFLEKMGDLSQEIEQIAQHRTELKAQKKKRYSPTDPESRRMKGRQGTHFGYNVQAAVDAEHKFLLAMIVTNHQDDSNLLKPMLEYLKTLGIEPSELLADTGYAVWEELFEIYGAEKPELFVPPRENGAGKRDEQNGITFSYDAEEGCYTCSQGKKLVPSRKPRPDPKTGVPIQEYRGKECEGCPVRKDCTTDAQGRTITRAYNQDWRDAHTAKMKSKKGKRKMQQRKALSEHPFGTLKTWMGAIHLKLRGLAKVQTEIDLYTLAYNFKRLANILPFEQIQSQIERFKWEMKMVVPGAG